jgi:hypothetical protein
VDATNRIQPAVHLINNLMKKFDHPDRMK